MNKKQYIKPEQRVVMLQHKCHILSTAFQSIHSSANITNGTTEPFAACILESVLSKPPMYQNVGESNYYGIFFVYFKFMLIFATGNQIYH